MSLFIELYNLRGYKNLMLMVESCIVYRTTHIAHRRWESFRSVARQYKAAGAAVFVVKLSDTQNPSNLVTNDDLAWRLNGANENEEEEVEVGANYKSLMILEEVEIFFFGCVK